MRKRYDFTAMLRALILCALTVFFYDLNASGKMLLYIHPRMLPFTRAAMFILGCMALYQASRIFTVKVVQYNRMRLGYLMIALPVLLAFSGPSEGLAPELAGNKSVQLGNGRVVNTAENQFASGKPVEQGDVSSSQPERFYSEKKAHPGLPNPVLGSAPHSDHVLAFTQESFTDDLEKLYTEIDCFIDLPVELEGFIYRDAQMEESEFVLARYLMSCCAADAQVIGLLCILDPGLQLPSAEWIHVRGTIQKTIYQGERVPCVAVTELVKTEQPENPFIYR